MLVPGTAIDITETDVYFEDVYADTPDLIDGIPVKDYVATATELSLQYLRDKLGVDPETYSYPRGHKPDFANPGYAYIQSHVPRFTDWCTENVLGMRVATLYEPERASLSDGKGLGDQGVTLLHHLEDAKAVRRRKVFGQRLLSADPAPGEYWMSLPSGNNVPLLEAIACRDSSLQPARMTCVDFSFTDLRNARRRAEQAGLNRVRQDYVWRDLTDPHGFIRPQRLKRTLAPLVIRERPIRGDMALPLGSADVVRIDGWFEYWTDNSKLSRHLDECLQLVKPGGRLVFNDVRETHPQKDFIRTVPGWPPYALRSFEQLRDEVLQPVRQKIAMADCYNLDDICRIVVLTKA